MKTTPVMLGFIGTIALTMGSAHAAPEEFGTSGQITLSASGGANLASSGTGLNLTPFIGFGSRSVSQPDRTVGTTVVSSTTKETTFLVNPGIDVFVIDRLSIGGEVLLGRESFSTESKTTVGAVTTTRTDESSGTVFGLMPRIGYAIPINPQFSLWPRGGLGFMRTSSSSGGDTTDSRSFLFADVHFLWHPSEKFFLGIGPGFTSILSHSVSDGTTSVDQSKPFTFRFLSFAIGGVVN